MGGDLVMNEKTTVGCQFQLLLTVQNVRVTIAAKQVTNRFGSKFGKKKRKNKNKKKEALVRTSSMEVIQEQSSLEDESGQSSEIDVELDDVDEKKQISEP